MTHPPVSTAAQARPSSAIRRWLVVSIAANIFLAVLLVIATRPARPPVVRPAPPNADVRVKTNVQVLHENFTWDQLDSTNYVVFVKNLRAVGCPEVTIRDIIDTEVERIFQKRRLEEVVYPNYEWWLSRPDAAAVKTAESKLQALDAEEQTMLASLLGAGWEPVNNEQIAARGGITLTGPILGELPSDVKETVLAIAARGQLKIEEYQTSCRAANGPVDEMTIVRLRLEAIRPLLPVLNPFQYLEYSLRYSPSAEQLRRQMRDMNLAKEQFHDLFNAISAINGQPIFYYAGTDSTTLAQRQQLQAQYNAVLKASLGDQLFATYQLNEDPVYQSSKSLAAQLGVADAGVLPLYQINRATQAELERISRDSSLSSDEKVEALAQTQIEQQQSLAQILGPETFQRLLITNSVVHP